ncbi:MAG: BatD family protein [Kiritimatiellae bacterium]|nr:BatD family protein [Kiritimatiellia bacterium]
MATKIHKKRIPYTPKASVFSFLLSPLRLFLCDLCVKKTSHILSSLILKHSVIILTTLVIFAFSAQAAVKLDVKANRKEIFTKEPLLLTIIVSGIKKTPQPDLSKIKNCEIEFLGDHEENKQYIERINGRIKQRSFYGHVFTFRITPLKTGKFIAGPIYLKLRNRTLSDHGPTIEVTGVEEQDIAILSLSSSRESVLVGEPFEITLSINLRCLKGSYSNTDPIPPSKPHSLDIPYLNGSPISGLTEKEHSETLRKFAIPSRGKPGFTINEYTYAPNPLAGVFSFRGADRKKKVRFSFPRKKTTLNGEKYFQYTMRTKYTPQKEGNYIFGPVGFKGKGITSVNSSGHPATKNIMTIGPACTVRVIPPPQKGRPDSYAGAIGANMTVTSEIDAQTCKVGDPLRLTLTVSGDISMDNIYPPHLGNIHDLKQNFKVYDDTVHTASKPNSTIYTYTIRPTTVGTMEIPPIPISFFDTTRRSYQTVTSEPIPIRANQATDAGEIHIFDTSTNATENILSLSIEDLRVPAPFMVSASGPISVNLQFTRWQVIMLLSIPAACIIFIILIQTQRKWHSKASLRHKLKALRRTSLALDRIVRSTSSVDSEIAGRIYTAMQEYAGQRSGVTEQGITPNDASILLKKHNVRTELLNQFNIILERNFNAAYSTETVKNYDPVVDAKDALTVIRNIDEGWK